MAAKPRSTKYPLWRSRNYRWTVGPKVDLPAARYLDEIACCNHVGSSAIAIELCAFPGSAWERTVFEAPPPASSGSIVANAGRACNSVGSQTEPGK